MRILITGATGLIGTELVSLLLQKRYRSALPHDLQKENHQGRKISRFFLESRAGHASMRTAFWVSM